MHPANAPYESIKKWARALKLNLPDTGDSSVRLKGLAEAIALLRLSKADAPPPEPDRASVHALVREHLSASQGQPALPATKRGGSSRLAALDRVMETLVMEAMQKKIEDSERQPFSSCQKKACH